MLPPTFLELLRGSLAVSVLHDVDLDTSGFGMTLTREPRVWIPWSKCRHALAGDHPETPAGRRRLATWVLARRWAADAGRDGLLQALRPVGLPFDHVLHPGLDWVRERVAGSVLDLGLGAVGLDPGDPDRVVLLPVPALDDARIDLDAAWEAAGAWLERMGALAAERVRLDPRGQLRPFGDCDAVTLLGARSLRTALADTAGGLAAAVAPMRRLAWTRLALIDPAFGPAAAAACHAEERGFARPLLITPDELALVPEGGRPGTIVLRDPALDRPWFGDALYH